MKGFPMKPSVTKYVKALCVIAIGIAICVVLIWQGDYDDAPGVSLLGILLMIGSVVLGS